MTPQRLVAIGFIFVCTSIAWAILGSTVVARTGEADYTLRREVEQLWGGVHAQRAPRAYWVHERTELREVDARDSQGRAIRTSKPVTVRDEISLPLTKSDVQVELVLAHRKKGLLWYSTYEVDFSADYEVSNPDAVARTIQLRFDFPSGEAIYDGFVFEVDGQSSAPVTNLTQGVGQVVTLAPGAVAKVRVAYRSRGLDKWDYRFGDGISQVRDFSLELRTNFADIDFPAGTLSPSVLQKNDESAELGWKFDSLVTSHSIGLTLPAKLNPGPLVVRISFFAPISLLFFFVVLIILGVMRGSSLHPMNYFFLSAAFFAFHLLLAYLVDHINVHLAFAISAATAVALVVSYLRLVAGARFAFLDAGVAQFVFLVLFSYAFFFEGQTGLSVVIGAVLTLFVLMQLTARVDWGDVFGGAHGVKPSGNPVGLPTFSAAPTASSAEETLAEEAKASS